MILKLLVGFLLGILIGAGGTVFLITSGAGNYVIAANPRVQSMESKIRELEDERTFLARRLEEIADRNDGMAKRFEELVTRFEAIQDARVRELEERVRRDAGTEAAPEPIEAPVAAEDDDALDTPSEQPSPEPAASPVA